MRNLKVITIIIFLVLTIAFSVFFSFDRMVTDHTPPIIYCEDKPLEVSVKASDYELCSGMTAVDDVDGDITDRIIVRRVSQLIGANSATVHYTVFDSSSNCCTFVRNIYYTDYSKPHFTLTQPLIYTVNSVISLQDRLTASDVIDGDISRRIRPFYSNISNEEVGDYRVNVQVTNSSGDTSIVEFTIMIRNTTARHPLIRLSDYLIYVDQNSELTFEELRNYIITARETRNGDSIDFEDIIISGDAPIGGTAIRPAEEKLDTGTLGSQNVYFSYTNEAGLEYTVILTVVVE